MGRKNGSTNRDAVWVVSPKDSPIIWDSRSHMGRGNFEGEPTQPSVKYRDALPGAVQKRPFYSRAI